MDRERVLELLKAHTGQLKQLGITSMSLFGSVARNEAGPESDIDLFVILEPPITFDRYIRAKFYLEDLLGSPVDLVLTDTIKPRARVAAQRDAIHA